MLPLLTAVATFLLAAPALLGLALPRDVPTVLGTLGIAVGCGALGAWPGWRATRSDVGGLAGVVALTSEVVLLSPIVVVPTLAVVEWVGARRSLHQAIGPIFQPVLEPSLWLLTFSWVAVAVAPLVGVLLAAVASDPWRGSRSGVVARAGLAALIPGIAAAATVARSNSDALVLAMLDVPVLVAVAAAWWLTRRRSDREPATRA